MKIFKDIGDNQMITTIWAMAILACSLIPMICGLYYHQRNLTVAQLIKDGKDPVEIACLYTVSSEMQGPCMLMIHKKTYSENK